MIDCVVSPFGDHIYVKAGLPTGLAVKVTGAFLHTVEVGFAVIVTVKGGTVSEIPVKSPGLVTPVAEITDPVTRFPFCHVDLFHIPVVILAIFPVISELVLANVPVKPYVNALIPDWLIVQYLVRKSVTLASSGCLSSVTRTAA